MTHSNKFSLLFWVALAISGIAVSILYPNIWVSLAGWALVLYWISAFAGVFQEHSEAKSELESEIAKSSEELFNDLFALLRSKDEQISALEHDRELLLLIVSSQSRPDGEFN